MFSVWFKDMRISHISLNTHQGIHSEVVGIGLNRLPLVTKQFVIQGWMKHIFWHISTMKMPEGKDTKNIEFIP